MEALGYRRAFVSVAVIFLAVGLVEAAAPMKAKGPLEITAIEGKVGTSPLRCEIKHDGHRASCRGTGFAGDPGFLNITLRNRGAKPLTVESSASSSTPDVDVSPKSETKTIPGKGSATFALRLQISPSAPPEKAEVTVEFTTES